VSKRAIPAGHKDALQGKDRAQWEPKGFCPLWKDCELLRGSQFVFLHLKCLAQPETNTSVSKGCLGNYF
jgi:hypothetical protein